VGHKRKSFSSTALITRKNRVGVALGTLLTFNLHRNPWKFLFRRPDLRTPFRQGAGFFSTRILGVFVLLARNFYAEIVTRLFYYASGAFKTPHTLTREQAARCLSAKRGGE
jgi:hypothetical protein